MGVFATARPGVVRSTTESVDGRYTIRTAADIAEVDPAEWDAILDPDDLQVAHRFIAVCQGSGVEDAAYRHVIVYQGSAVAAVASFSRMAVRLELLSPGLLRSVVRLGRRWTPRLFRVPVAFCGLPVSFGQPCLRVRPDADRAAIAAILSDQLEAFASDVGANILCFKEFTPEDEAVVEPLEALGYFRAASLPSCHLDLPWPSFDTYVAAMRAGYRRQIAVTLQRRTTHGLTLRTVRDFAAWCPDIFSLYEQVMDRAPYQLERLNQRFFERLNATLETESGAILLEQDGQLAAAAILLYGPRVVTFLLTGIDYALDRRCQAYPNLLVEVVAEAIRHGARRLEMGQTSYELKRRLGASTTPRALYLRHRRPVAHRLLGAASRMLFPNLVLSPRRVHRST